MIGVFLLIEPIFIVFDYDSANNQTGILCGSTCRPPLPSYLNMFVFCICLYNAEHKELNGHGELDSQTIGSAVDVRKMSCNPF